MHPIGLTPLVVYACCEICENAAFAAISWCTLSCVRREQQRWVRHRRADCSMCAAVHSQKAVSAWFTSEQILHFDFAEECGRVPIPSKQETLNQCWCNAGPVLAPHYASTGSTCHVFAGKLLYCFMSYSHFQQTRRWLDPMLFQCWPTAYGAGPTLKHHWVKSSCNCSLCPPVMIALCCLLSSQTGMLSWRLCFLLQCSL